MMSPRFWIIFGAISAALAVGFGAYHAHGLKQRLEGRELPAETVVQKLRDFEVGVRYQMSHALALVLVGLIAAKWPSRGVQAAGGLFVIGTLLFSGCLYFPVLTGLKLHWALVPSGGLALILGWVVLAIGVATSKMGGTP